MTQSRSASRTNNHNYNHGHGHGHGHGQHHDELPFHRSELGRPELDQPRLDRPHSARKPRSALPRWVYQETVRRIFDDTPDRHLQLVGRPISGAMMFRPQPTADFVVRPADLWLFQTSPRGLAQVECVREVSKALVPRMMFYREVITRARPYQPLDQYVIVIGDGTVREINDPVYTGDYFGLHVLYLSDVDPSAFGTSPGFTLLRHCAEAPPFGELLFEADLALGRFLVSLQDDVHGDAVLQDSGGPDRTGIPEQLLELFFQGRFGDPPDVPAEQRDQGWPTDVAVALAVHTITDFARVRPRALGQGQGQSQGLGRGRALDLGRARGRAPGQGRN